ncbi:MAG: hypothetical protein GY722_16395 [bacterium]|nr:hypothetical protein [bacterium]
MVLGLSLVFLGLVIGTFIGGRYFVAPGSGLAGPAIALGYGAFGALVGLVLALLAARLAPATVLTRATRAAVALVVLAACVITWRLVALCPSGPSGPKARKGGATPIGHDDPRRSAVSELVHFRA